jgi:hypothetical protein
MLPIRFAVTKQVTNSGGWQNALSIFNKLTQACQYTVRGFARFRMGAANMPCCLLHVLIDEDLIAVGVFEGDVGRAGCGFVGLFD